jgi:D-alanyl-D-alanine carboxypeptidase (penicillin-binding protein 5/6)
LPKRIVPVIIVAVLATVPLGAAVPPVATPPVLPSTLEITAPTAVMIDVGSGRVLFERQSHRRFLPASLTKIMTSYVAFELIAQGKLKLGQRFPMRPETFRQWHRVGSTMFIENNAQVSVADLLSGIVTVSANDACVVLAEGIADSVPGFTAMMNAQAKALGMKDTHYHTPNGWMDEGQTYVSAADLATLSMAMIVKHPDLYARFYGHDRMTWNGISQENHNPLYGHTPGADGVKTGFTNEAGYGFVGSVIRDGRRLMMVVGGYDRPAVRAKESRDFIEWGFAAWDALPLFQAGAHVGEATVQGGNARAVGLVAPQRLFVTVPKGAAHRYNLSIRYKGPLRAPIAKGEPVATLVVKVRGLPDEQVSLVAADAVGKASAVDRLRNGFLDIVGS